MDLEAHTTMDLQMNRTDSSLNKCDTELRVTVKNAKPEQQTSLSYKVITIKSFPHTPTIKSYPRAVSDYR